MKFHKNKFLTTVSAIALVLAVGACSSSSDDEGNSMLQTDLDAAIAKAAALQEDLDEANADLISVRGMLTQANLDLEQARAALEMAKDNTDDEEEIARLKQAVTDAERMRDGYKTDLDAANLELAKMQAVVDEAKRKKALAENIAREAKIQAAIVVGRVTATAKATPTDDASGVTGVTATRNAAGMVAVDVNGNDVADDYVDVDGETIAGSGGWNGVTMTSGTNTLVVYTDIEAPTDRDFGDKYPSDVLNDALAVGNVGNVASDGFPSAPGTTWTYGGDAGRETTVIGTFDDVDGQFTCTMTPCTVMAGAMGTLAASPNWEFRADSQNTATARSRMQLTLTSVGG